MKEVDVKPTEKELHNRFTYHAPKPGQPAKYEDIRAAGRYLAHLLVNLCPDGRELSLAVTKLEESIMWANAAIARSDIGETPAADHQPASYMERRIERALITIGAQLDNVVHNTNSIRKKEKQIMGQLEDLKAKVQVATEKILNLNTSLDGYREAMKLQKEQLATLQAQIADLVSGVVLPETVQAKVKDIADGVDAAIAAVDNTMEENFPVTPPPVEPPVEPPPVTPEV
jgi:predicted nuclease with TOPRIM domain